MDLIPSAEFLAGAGALGIAPDDRYRPPQCLVYVPHRAHDRFWNVPDRLAGLPNFLAHMLSGLSRWSECWLWPRGGRWPDVPEEGGRIKDAVRGVILGGAGIPAGYEGAAWYEADEVDRLVTALFAQLVFGWSVRDDVFVIPDHGRCIFWTDHHDVVHVRFRDAADVAPFVAHMAREKYTLPDAVPDETFKKPTWMP